MSAVMTMNAKAASVTAKRHHRFEVSPGTESQMW